MNVCSIAGVDLPQPPIPVNGQTLEIQMAVYPLNKITTDPNTGDLQCPTVVAFDARDFKAEVIAAIKRSRARIYVDRMGLTDAPAGWQAAIDAGADGIQTDRPGELVGYLRSKGYK